MLVYNLRNRRIINSETEMADSEGNLNEQYTETSEGYSGDSSPVDSDNLEDNSEASNDQVGMGAVNDPHTTQTHDSTSEGKEDPLKIIMAGLKEELGALFQQNRREIAVKLDENRKEIQEVSKEVKNLQSLKTIVEKIQKDVGFLEKKIENKIVEKTEEIRNEISKKISVIENTVEKVDARITTEIASVRRELSAKTVEIDNEALKRVEQRLDEFQQEKNRICDTLEIVRNRPIVVNTNCRGFDDVPKFDKFRENPIQFLIKIKEYLQRNSRESWAEQAGVMEKSFDNQEAAWWMIVQTTITTFEVFEEKFKAKFWNEKIQDTVRDRMKNGKFVRGRKLNANEYFIKQVLIARNLEPAMSEEEIIVKLAKHYGVGLESARFNRNIKTVENMERLLEEWTEQNIDADQKGLKEAGKKENKIANQNSMERSNQSPKFERRNYDNQQEQRQNDNRQDRRNYGNQNYNHNNHFNGGGRGGRWNSNYHEDRRNNDYQQSRRNNGERNHNRSNEDVNKDDKTGTAKVAESNKTKN
ncbi:uncharacterized protein MAL13P1.304-like [Nilaparvata lugens]|uniref:uncharacterized protein MAL13P1.304-like n=1 Tax=Nilaparvata lugens TaxID=108931 RepID=UPI00193DC746|nr:uncharacterized protein MAL13P1.304-like [Nilaparvata lugens]